MSKRTNAKRIQCRTQKRCYTGYAGTPKGIQRNGPKVPADNQIRSCRGKYDTRKKEDSNNKKSD